MMTMSEIGRVGTDLTILSPIDDVLMVTVGMEESVGETELAPVKY